MSLLLIAVFFGAGRVNAAQHQVHTSPKEERLEFYKWFDSLDFPEVSLGRFVVFTIDGRTNYGFLAPRSNGQNEITELDLNRVRIEDSPNAQIAKRAKVAPVDLRSWIKGELREIKKEKPFDLATSDHGLPNSFFGMMVLSKACASRDLESSSIELFDLCRGISVHAFGNTESAPTLKEFQSIFGRTYCKSTLEMFNHVEVPRAELLRRFKWLRSTCPELSDNSLDGKSFVSFAIPKLEKMVAEDRAHVHHMTFASTDARIQDLIYHLRDLTRDEVLQASSQLRISKENGPYLRDEQINEIATIHSKPMDTKSPDAQLIAMGYKAVPRLIEALTNVAFTRAHRGTTTWSVSKSSKSEMLPWASSIA